MPTLPLALLVLSVVAWCWSLMLAPHTIQGLRLKSRLITCFAWAVVACTVWLMLAGSHYGRW